MFIVNQLYPRDSLREFANTGDTQSGILSPAGKKVGEVDYVVLTTGGKHGEKVGYVDDQLVNGDWVYYGQGREGHQNPDRFANTMLLDPNSKKLLFSTRQPTREEVKRRGSESKYYKFEGIFTIRAWEIETCRKGSRKGDKLIRTLLRPAEDVGGVAETIDANGDTGELGTASLSFSDAADDPEKMQLVARRVRRGQKKFRKNLIEAYSGKCVVSGVDVLGVLDAAHIVNHSESGKNSVANGILLRADLHNLFDDGLLKISPYNHTVEICDSLAGSRYEKFNGVKISARLDGEFPDQELLKRKYE